MGSQTFWSWRLTLAIQKDISGSLNGKLMHLSFFTKSFAHEAAQQIFLMSEVEHLIFDPILIVVVFALADGAFESEIKSVADVFRTRLKAPCRSLQLRFKDSMLSVPIFRQAVPSANGVQTSPTKVLRYYTYLFYLQRLGQLTGFMQILTSYDIRRGTGNELDGKCSVFN